MNFKNSKTLAICLTVASFALTTINCKKKEEDKTPQLAAAALILNSQNAGGSTSATSYSTATDAQKSYMDSLKKSLMDKGLTAAQADIVVGGATRKSIKMSALELSVRNMKLSERERSAILIRATGNDLATDAPLTLSDADKKDVTKVVSYMVANSLAALETLVDSGGYEPSAPPTGNKTNATKPSLPEIAALISASAVNTVASSSSVAAKDKAATVQKIASASTANAEGYIKKANVKLATKLTAKGTAPATIAATTSTKSSTVATKLITKAVVSAATKKGSTTAIATKAKDKAAIAKAVVKSSLKGVSAATIAAKTDTTRKPITKPTTDKTLKVKCAVKDTKCKTRQKARVKKSILENMMARLSGEPKPQKRTSTPDPVDDVTDPTEDQMINSAVQGAILATDDASGVSTSVRGITDTTVKTDMALMMKEISNGAAQGLNNFVPANLDPNIGVTDPNILAQYAKAVSSASMAAMPYAAGMVPSTGVPTAPTADQIKAIATLIKSVSQGTVAAMDSITIPPMVNSGETAPSAPVAGNTATTAASDARSLLLQGIVQGGISQAGQLGAAGGTKANIQDLMGTVSQGALMGLPAGGMNPNNSITASASIAAAVTGSMDMVKIQPVSGSLRAETFDPKADLKVSIEKSMADTLAGIKAMNYDPINNPEGFKDVLNTAEKQNLVSTVAGGATASLDEISGLTANDLKSMNLTSAITKAAVANAAAAGIPATKISEVSKGIVSDVSKEASELVDPASEDTSVDPMFSTTDLTAEAKELQGAVKDAAYECVDENGVAITGVSKTIADAAGEFDVNALASGTFQDGIPDYVDCTDSANSENAVCKESAPTSATGDSGDPTASISDTATTVITFTDRLECFYAVVEADCTANSSLCAWSTTNSLCEPKTALTLTDATACYSAIPFDCKANATLCAFDAVSDTCSVKPGAAGFDCTTITDAGTCGMNYSSCTWNVTDFTTGAGNCATVPAFNPTTEADCMFTFEQSTCETSTLCKYTQNNGGMCIGKSIVDITDSTLCSAETDMNNCHASSACVVDWANNVCAAKVTDSTKCADITSMDLCYANYTKCAASTDDTGNFKCSAADSTTVSQ